ncbi:MAG: sigma-54-dependent Fis family transcriptional regulator [Desulfobacteraceae bacterium]|nr:MAG: sigma-54-dependent Fis family transcriptional regulator [Desulfobacteraceae bacterium]
MDYRILVVDDDASLRKMLDAVLTEDGYEITQADDGSKAVSAVKERFYDLILMDIRMAQIGGIVALKKIKKLNPEIPVIIMTAYASVDTARDALKSGAFDYLTKPLDIDELKLIVRRALRHHQLEQENRYLKERLDDRFDFSNIIGSSRPMRRLFETLALVAPTEATVLVTGESGTGKELIANAIHQNSPRRDHPMVKVNCAALPETLLESELFGHEKGAFTGAISRSRGKFQLAHRSTLFLDEISEMTPATQAKILRALQEREVEPVGGDKTIAVDTRIVAATHRNLEDEVKGGRFREDLYYRLNVVKVEIPPLRSRPEDIPLLSELFLKRFVEKNRKMIKGFTPKSVDILMRHDWPGNVRELENVVERAVIMATGDRITPEDFPAALTESEAPERVDRSGNPSARTLKEMEREMILRTLAETGGNRTHAAKILGISRRTLQLKIKEYGID